MLVCASRCRSTTANVIKLRQSARNLYSRYVFQTRETQNPFWRAFSTKETRLKSTKKPFVITTPIFYVNARPHIGHLYSALLADGLARWKRLNGEEVLFTTGTDEHGQKIQRAAAAKGVDPRCFCDEVSKTFRDCFDLFNISYDDFIRTSESRHAAIVQRTWRTLVENGWIYMGTYSGWYCTSDEAFVTEAQIEKAETGDGYVSKDSGHPVEYLEESNYKFRLSEFQDSLLRWLDAHPDAVQPESRMNEVRRQMEQGLGDVAVSRLRDRLSWGISVPDDADHVVYVWFDALLNYLTAAEDCNAWPCDVHVLGKDIIRFHGVYWPAFLMGAKHELPKRLVVHGHWLVDKVKMSKSIGNVIDPTELADGHAIDAVRYFLLNEAAGLDHDSHFSLGQLKRRTNADLVHTLGNLANRCVAPALHPDPDARPQMTGPLTDSDARLVAAANQLYGQVDEHYSQLHFNAATKAVFDLLRDTNKYFQDNTPWLLVPKKDREGDVPRLQQVLFITLEVLRITGFALHPVLPHSSNKLLRLLGIGPGQIPCEKTSRGEIENLLQVRDGAVEFEIGSVETLFSEVK